MSQNSALFAALAGLFGALVFLNGLAIARTGRSIFGFRAAPLLRDTPFTERTAGLFMMAVAVLWTVMMVSMLLGVFGDMA